MTNSEKALKMHEEWHGKIETCAKSHVNSREDLAIAYTPGVAEPCKVIARDPEAAYTYTMKSNTVAVVSDGSAVLGLGNIGALAAMPVMEGKAVLFKEFGGVNAVPICLDTQDTEEIIKSVVNIAPAFGGINLEDISAPRCFEIEERLKELLDIPVFHDDQHGTAIVVAAGLTNALRYVHKEFSEAKVVINGAGSAGISICRLLLELGIGDVVLVDRNGILAPGEEWMNPAQKEMAEITNKERLHGDLKTAMKGRDIFVGVSAPNIVTAEMVSTMADDAIVFAMANPTPEIMPDEAKKGGAKVVATGRSDFPNQINNVLVFPGVFRGAFDVRASDINEEMKIAAAKAIADLVEEGANVVISHSNGPQVGMIHTAMNEFGKAHPDYTFAPMSVCSAMSQGYIGYDLQNALKEELLNRGLQQGVATVLTQVVVDGNDPAFQHPTKPIGAFMSKEEAEKMAREKGWHITEDAGRGWRQVVASPRPLAVVELTTIRALAEADNVVIACGGGGIPVIATDHHHLKGAAAVIDKDLASELLAEHLDADMLIILTAVEKVAVNFNKPNQKWLDALTPEEARTYIGEGQFAPGSMLPKVEAAVKFAESKPGRTALITLLEKARDGIDGKTGTRIAC